MRNIIVTFHQKKYNSFLKIVEERFKKYARKCNAEFLNVEIPADAEKPLLYKYFYIGNKLPKAKKYLVIDLDILVRKDSPNIFEMVPAGFVGMYNEASAFHTVYGTNGDEISIRWNLIKQLIKDAKLQDVHMEETFYWNTPFKYYNNGVVLYDERGLEIHRCFNDEEKKNIYKCDMVCLDQNLINYSIIKNNTKVFHLPICFNQMPYNRCADYKQASFFSHYAGLNPDIKNQEIHDDNKFWLENDF